jgi:hypothetical protein
MNTDRILDLPGPRFVALVLLLGAGDVAWLYVLWLIWAARGLA